MRQLSRSFVILVLLALGGSVGAAPSVVSNTSVILISSTTEPASGELSIVGQLHVQARVEATGGVDIKANLTDTAFAFAVAGMELPPEVDAIKARIAEIKAELVSLQEQWAAVMKELEEIRRANEFFPELPIEYKTERLRELQAKAAELAARMQALQEELRALVERLRNLLRELAESRPDLVTLYTPLGADAVAGANCTDDLLCDSVLNFDLVGDDGQVRPLQIQLTLQFTTDGSLVAADALACVFTCDLDSGICSCT